METQTIDSDKMTKQIHDLVKKLDVKLSKEDRLFLEEALSKVMLHNDLPKNALGITPEVMEAIYQQGYLLFQNGKYDDALTIFNVLRTLDINSSRYTFAIAACYHYKKEYLNAAANYLIYKEMKPLDPIPSYHLFDCFSKANIPLSALFYIQNALALADKDPKYAALKEKIKLESDHYNEFLKKYYQEKYPAEKNKGELLW